MTLWQVLRRVSKGSPFWTQFRFWVLVVLFSPLIIAVYLGMWSEGWLDERSRRGRSDNRDA